MGNLFDELSDDEVELIRAISELADVDEEFAKKLHTYVEAYSRENADLGDEAFEVDEEKRDRLFALTDFFSGKAYDFGNSESDTSAIPHEESGVFQVKVKRFMLLKPDIEQFIDVIKGTTITGFLPTHDGRVKIDCDITGVHKLRENEFGDDKTE